mmetsp:Transcript_26695/g.70817  ORF Transcript_26695/g.70817 Transcript_26695/m.70817 type:complete len:129 (-) Transcript_26695:315-701(-)
MIVVPMFGDQPLNGDAIAKCGAGLNFRMPLQSVTTEALRTAMGQLLEPTPHQGGLSSYQEAARVMAGKLAAAGGAAAAVDAILQAAHSWMASEANPRLLGRSEPQSKEHRCDASGDLDTQDAIGACAH